MYDGTDMILDAQERSFSDLDKRVTYLSTRNFKMVVPTVCVISMSTQRIDKIIKDDWELVVNYRSSQVSKERKKIFLERGLEGLLRDRHLFHELVHVVCWPYLDDSYCAEDRFDNNTVAEWLGRKYRANPELLRHAVLSFKLTPYVYDASSYQAFVGVDLSRQSEFPFAKGYYDSLRKIMMEP